VPSFANLLASRAKKFRQNVRRAGRAAAEASYDIRIVTGLTGYYALRSTVSAIAALSWKAAGRDGESLHAPFEGRQRQFLDHLCRSGDTEILPVVSELVIASAPAAVLVSVLWRGVLTMLFTFVDPGATRFSPGTLLIGATIDWAHAQGALTVDYNSNSPHTRHYANTSEGVENLIVFNRTIRGQFCHLLARMSGGIPRRRRN
jgi:CelD/BcsL family acetyltransferase involved in cellulose biosynthesis